MQEQYLNKQYDGRCIADWRKLRRKRNKGKKIALAIILVVVLMIVILVIFRIDKNPNRLIGTWVYDNHTKYVFENDGRGKLVTDDIIYEYTYKHNGEKLIIDFTEDIVRDCDYTFSIDGSATLTLIGGDGTDGGTYILNKK